MRDNAIGDAPSDNQAALKINSNAIGGLVSLADFDNAKYWFRRVGEHPIYEQLCPAAAELAVAAPPTAAFLRTQSRWDPFAFVDLCAAALVGRAACVDLCVQIGKREWQLLFDWCYFQAIF